MIEELASVVLKVDMKEQGLQAGDIGTVVLVHQGGKGYTVEFMTLSGDTVAVVTVPAEHVRMFGPDAERQETLDQLTQYSEELGLYDA